MDKTVFVLASQSPRRRELLKNIGINAEVVPAKIDESALEGLEPERMVTELAMLKACDVARSFKGNVIVIAADTCVCIDGRVMGKPRSRKEASQMLSTLSGNTHEVYTGYCVFNCADKNAVAKHEVTKVTFKEISQKEIDSYIDTREPMDKAGAYGIQGKGAAFIEKIEGDYFNVVGLPICSLVKLLSKEFNTEIF